MDRNKEAVEGGIADASRPPHGGVDRNKIEWTLSVGDLVAPHTGAWIETLNRNDEVALMSVAPHTGAWIETLSRQLFAKTTHVAPHTGAWIETVRQVLSFSNSSSRPPHGGVDRNILAQ